MKKLCILIIMFFSSGGYAFDDKFQITINEAFRGEIYKTNQMAEMFFNDENNETYMVNSNKIIKLDELNTKTKRFDKLETIVEFDANIVSVFSDKKTNIFVITNNNYWDVSEPCNIYHAKNLSEDFQLINTFYGGCPLNWSIDKMDDEVFFAMYGPWQTPSTKQIWKYNLVSQNWSMVYQFKDTGKLHMHALHFDKVSKNLWLSTGDAGRNKALYVSKDKGKIWQKKQRIQPTAIVSTDDGVYFGSDSPRFSRVSFYNRNKDKIKTVLELNSKENLSGRVYDIMPLKKNWLLAAFLKYAGDGHDASIWLGKNDQWFKLLSINTAEENAINLSSMAYFNNSKQVVVNGIVIDIDTIINELE